MKRCLLELLCCPVCQGLFKLTPFAEGADVEEGLLTCTGCARVFPVINGIPRLLPDELAHMVVRAHRSFFQRHAEAMTSYVARCQAPSRERWWRAEQRTVKSFSYQWRTFKKMLPHWEGVFRDSIAPIEPSFFHDKVGLDAGCGFGRSLHYAASYGAEMIGIDLSEAVEAARDNTRQFPGVHLVQGDLYHLPIRAHSLDFVYSIGVLHHLPDPKGGFVALTRLLKPEGEIFIWVYARGRGRQIPFLTLMRAVSTHLPLRILNPVCLVCAGIEWFLWVIPYRLLSRFAPTRGLARRLPFTFHARFPFYVAHTDWFDGLSVPLVHYHRREEIAAWFREAGLRQHGADPLWGKEGGGRARGGTSAFLQEEASLR